MTTALNVASYIRDALQLPSYDTMKLQKLVYFSQAWALAWTGKPLFRDEIEAWPRGPVVMSVYAEQRYRVVPKFDGVSLDEDQRSIIDSVLDYYGQHSFTKLVDLTHSHSPWKATREGLAEEERSRRVVSRDRIRDYYTRCALTGQERPKRRLLGRAAPSVEAMTAGARARASWREGLAILAER
ncbi:type II toxin-antitoxin system antitoxin SocA domain-containing protein [Curtobacterium sp. UCD-KPL2560]|uniref:Panacea domain-containing protein n=1 Tax=Curtobacterium sp. UCD-KPL2560 TaxID=1885315 RepID=UPI000826789E|nr:type II toxin-antitoxin system antitoxin SocA domain-containing protein [Curtobacterium sp. UCD-KPL2560]